MSRLIDADDLIVEILTHDLIGDDKEVDKIILDAPTVKAIPIEWLKEWAMKNWVKSKKCEYDIIVSKLIDDWLEKENEGKTN